MHSTAGLSVWLTRHSLEVQAASAAASVILTAVLVGTTIAYVLITNRILVESQKARVAAEGQASSARKTVEVLQQQIEDQSGLGRSIVQSAIDSAVSAIAYWKAQDLPTLARLRGLPPTESLVPANAVSAVGHASRIDSSIGQLVSSAFDDLTNVRNEIEAMKGVDDVVGRGMDFYKHTTYSAERYLSSAFEKLQRARSSLLAGGADSD
jgi:hypothetical protein